MELRFRVVSPFVVIQPNNTGPPFLTVPIGSIIETREEVHSPGLAEIRLNDKLLLAFMRDIEDRAVPLE